MEKSNNLHASTQLSVYLRLKLDSQTKSKRIYANTNYLQLMQRAQEFLQEHEETKGSTVRKITSNALKFPVTCNQHILEAIQLV